MNRIEDMETNVGVRRVLVRHWVDLGRVSVRTTRGVVWVSGSLMRVKNGGGDLHNEEILGIFHEIKAIRGVRRVHSKLLNWSGEIDEPLAEARVTQSSGPVNTYEAKVNTALSLEDVLAALGTPKEKKSEEPKEPITR